MEFRRLELTRAQVHEMAPNAKGHLFEYVVVVDPELIARTSN